jgi:hypothetical protein
MYRIILSSLEIMEMKAQMNLQKEKEQEARVEG